eukprot:365349-Chlamydomonas_euryale.AAC.10
MEREALTEGRGAVGHLLKHMLRCPGPRFPPTQSAPMYTQWCDPQCAHVHPMVRPPMRPCTPNGATPCEHASTRACPLTRLAVHLLSPGGRARHVLATHACELVVVGPLLGVLQTRACRYALVRQSHSAHR